MPCGRPWPPELLAGASRAPDCARMPAKPPAGGEDGRGGQAGVQRHHGPGRFIAVGRFPGICRAERNGVFRARAPDSARGGRRAGDAERPVLPAGRRGTPPRVVWPRRCSWDGRRTAVAHRSRDPECRRASTEGAPAFVSARGCGARVALKFDPLRTRCPQCSQGGARFGHLVGNRRRGALRSIVFGHDGTETLTPTYATPAAQDRRTGQAPSGRLHVSIFGQGVVK